MRVWFVMAVFAAVNFVMWFAGWEIPGWPGQGGFLIYAACFWAVAAVVMFVQEKRG